MVNYGLGGVSAFGSLGILLDSGFLLIFGLLSLFLAFKLHAKTLERRFKG